MKISKYIVNTLLVALPMVASSQTTYLIAGGKEESLLNRLEIKTRTKTLSFSSVKPYNRRDIVKDVELYDSLYNAGDKRAKGITDIDKYNMQRLLMNNSEWSKPRETYISEKPILKYFYQTRGNMVEMKSKDFTLIANPIIQYQQGSNGGNPSGTFINQRGAVIRGMIGEKIGFDFYFTENQERQPIYVQDWVNKYGAIPGVGFRKGFKVNGYDYFDVRSSLTWKVAKFMDMQLGYGRNFIGDGYRSLLLSDFSTNAMYLKVNTHFGKFNYENIFSELVPPLHRIGGDYLYPRKYYRVSYLNFNANKWLTLGLFDGVMLGKSDALSFGLLNPVIYAHIPNDNSNGIKDKSYTGFTVKMNLAKKVQLYGQGMIDKIKLDELKNNWWGNKFGYQAGLKYIDAFGFKNVDVQLETNRVRPFTYSSSDSTTSYNHYNQPLAHPLGANFEEYIAIVKYQPVKQLYLEAKAIYYRQGLDSSIAGINQNYGGNIFSFNSTRALGDNGWTVGVGDLAKCTIITFLVSYEIKENLFFDVSFLSRQYNRMSTGSANTSVFSAGIRFNIGRREFMF